MRFFRYVFYFFWNGAVPFALAIASVWLLTPPPGTRAPGGLRVLVGEQQVPAAILFFTLYALVLWRWRYDLPLSQAAGVGGRRDLPPAARGRYEDALALIDEARRILRSFRRDVEREVTASERKQLEQVLVSLERATSSPRFDLAEFQAAHARADKLVGEHLARWRKSELREYLESMSGAVTIAVLLRVFVFEAYKIPSASMVPTLMVGDNIFLNKIAYGPLIPWTDTRLFTRGRPERADVMVFKFPENKEQDYIKRVIGLEGDTIESINGRPVINGWVAPHCYVGQFRGDFRSSELYVEFLHDKAYLTLFNNNTDEQTCTANEECGSPGLACRAGICGTLNGPFRVAEGEFFVMGDNRDNSSDSRAWHGGQGRGVPFEFVRGRAMFVWMSFGPGGGIAQDRLGVQVLGLPRLPASQEVALAPSLEKCLAGRPPLSQTEPPLPQAKR